MTGTPPDEPPTREIPQTRDAPHDPDQPELARAAGELASENADLYKKVGDLTHALKLERARFGAWAKDVARDREEAAQDKAQTAERLDKALAMNEALANRVTDLERKFADESPATDAGAPGRRIDAGRGRAEHVRQHCGGRGDAHRADSPTPGSASPSQRGQPQAARRGTSALTSSSCRGSAP